jgi:hypothetical protein
MTASPFDGEQERISLLHNPCGHRFRLLVGQPRIQDRRIVAVIGNA